MSLPVVLVRVGSDTVPLVAGTDGNGQTVGYNLVDQKVVPFAVADVDGVVNIDPAAVYFGVDLVENEQEMRMAAEHMRSLRRAPHLHPDERRHMMQHGVDHSCFPCGLQDAREDRAPSLHRVGWYDRDLTSLEEYAATFLANVESDGDPYEFQHDPRVETIVRTLYALGLRDVGTILGAGTFGTAALLDDHTVIKITSDPSEVQAGSILKGKRLKHVARIYESWFIRGVRATTVIKRRYPVGVLYSERVQPLPDSKSADELSNLVNEFKEQTHTYPRSLARLDRAAQREKLKNASINLERTLRQQGHELRRVDMMEDVYLVEGVADALRELRDHGVYAIDVHAGNVGYVDSDSGGILYKVFDIGSSSPPARPKAKVIDDERVPEQLELPGMFEEGVGAAEWIGDRSDELEKNQVYVDTGAEEADGDCPRPFSGPLYRKRTEHTPGSCVVCGLTIKNENDAEWATVIEGGSRFEMLSDSPTPEDAPGYMGMFPVGPECARKLAKCGARLGKMDTGAEEAPKAHRYAPQGAKFTPIETLATGEPFVTGYTEVRPQLMKHRDRVPSVETIRLCSIFAISTIRVQIDVAERRFDCLKELWGDRPGAEFEPWDLEAVKSCFQGMQNGMGDTVLNVSAWAPTVHNAIGKKKLKDRELRRYLAVENKLPHGLGLAKVSFTLALLGQDTVCLDSRLLDRMFGSDANKVGKTWNKRPDGTLSEEHLKAYEAAEDAFLKGNKFYEPKDVVGRARAQWMSWETVGGKPAAHHSWLDVVR
jgi:hypothetical protein